MAGDKAKRDAGTRKEAKECGALHYWTGRPCKRSHVSWRDTKSGKCLQCGPEYGRAWRLNHPRDPEKQSKYNKEWRVKNKERKALSDKKWREENRDRVNKNHREWCRNNRDKVAASSARHQQKKGIARQREYYRENIVWYQSYRAEHRAELTAHERTRRARKAASEGQHTAADVAEIRKLQKDRCAICAIRLNGKGDVDHIVALARGGSNGRQNLQILCKKCNNSKRASDQIDYMRKLGRLL